MPAANVLLWQFTQGVAATTEWFIVAGLQAAVRWQLSQAAAGLVPPLCMAGIPVADLPWQVAQEPGTTPVWLYPPLTSSQFPPPILWQLSQDSDVTTW